MLFLATDEHGCTRIVDACATTTAAESKLFCFYLCQSVFIRGKKVSELLQMRFEIAAQEFMEVQHAVFGGRLVRADFFDALPVKGFATLLHF